MSIDTIPDKTHGITVRLDDETMHKVSYISARNCLSKNKVINDFIKSSLRVLDALGQVIWDDDIKTFKGVELAATKLKVLDLHCLLQTLEHMRKETEEVQAILDDVRRIINDKKARK